MHPFLALVIGSAVVGIGGGVGIADVIANFETGVGATLQEVGLSIALGAMLGKLLSDSGGADRVVDTLVTRSGPRLLPWAIKLSVGQTFKTWSVMETVLSIVAFLVIDLLWALT